VLIAGHDTVVEHHEAAAPPEVVLKTGPLLADDPHAIGGIDDDDIRRVELGLGRELHRAVHPDAPFTQELRPVSEEPRVVVLVGPMCLDPAADEDAEGIGRLEDLEGQQGSAGRHEETMESAHTHGVSGV